MIKNLALTFGSETKAQEIVFLLKDIKKVVRQGFYEEELEKVKRYCEKEKLFVVKSKFKVLLTDEENYSNKGIRVKKDDKRLGMYFIYISKNEQKAWLSAYYELIGNDAALGELLGYPGCCIKYFCDHFNERNTNPEQKSNDIFTNISKRGEDLVLISHFPCSAECQETISLAKNNLKILEEVDPKRTAELISALK
jgi:hypothetical protein